MKFFDIVVFVGWMGRVILFVVMVFVYVVGSVVW